jgi:hypothetical protein
MNGILNSMENKLTKAGNEGGIRSHSTDVIFENLTEKTVIRNPVIERLSTGKYRIFWEYLDLLGLANDKNLLVLSPSKHYYYDFEDLKEVSTLLNLKHLNHIRDSADFLKTVNKMISNGSFFIGSFIDRKYQYSFFSNSAYPEPLLKGDVDPVENGIVSRIPLLNMIFDFMDSRTNNRNLTQKSVTRLLDEAGFKVIDMTEIRGVTCFCCRKEF